VQHLAHFRRGQEDARLATLRYQEAVAVGMAFDASGELTERAMRHAGDACMYVRAPAARARFSAAFL
jgi:xanthine dehydrogenase molybdopterin-binding subunit B